MTRKQAKEKILSDFEFMKAFEQSAQNFYTRICSDPRVKDSQVKNTLKEIAEDENRHTEIVQEIINIVTNAL